MTREGEAETARCERENVRLATVSAHRPAFPCAASTRSWAQEHPPVWAERKRCQPSVRRPRRDHAGTRCRKARYSRPAAVPQNRAQRRAEKRQKDKHKPPVSYPAQPAAAQMVERVDKAARRRQLLDELAALENG